MQVPSIPVAAGSAERFARTVADEMAALGADVVFEWRDIGPTSRLIDGTVKGPRATRDIVVTLPPLSKTRKVHVTMLMPAYLFEAEADALSVAELFMKLGRSNTPELLAKL